MDAGSVGEAPVFLTGLFPVPPLNFASVPPPQAYWLSKRAQSVKTVVPSTYMKGMNVT